MEQSGTPEKVASNDGLGCADPSRDAFERHVLQWTGRDMAYHHRNQTTGLEFAWHCWQAAAAARPEEIPQASPGTAQLTDGPVGGLALAVESDLCLTWTYAQRCELAEKCLPKADYRTRLERLHADMLAEIASKQSAIDMLNTMNDSAMVGFLRMAAQRPARRLSADARQHGTRRDPLAAPAGPPA